MIRQRSKMGRALCGARTRQGRPCLREVVEGNARCRNHGGCSTGPKSAEGKRKLLEYGIAPPGPLLADGAVPIRIVGRRQAAVPCPRCASVHTERLSAFGSTACKSLHRCLDCREPFEHFKPI